MAQLIDGKAISKQIKDELKEQVAELSAKGVKICLAVIQVGNDPASSVYVGNKKKACAYIGIDSLSYELPEETTEEELLELIDKLNKDDAVNGILVLLISTVSVRYIKLFQGIYQFLASGIPMYGLLVLLPLLLLFLHWRQNKNQNPKQLSEGEKA